MKYTSLVTLVLLGFATVAFAQEQPTTPPPPKPKTPVITKRQAKQHARIHQGVKSGELTKGEAAKLRAEQRKIAAEKRVAKADGKVTPAEKRIITKDQNKASRDIYRLKHNKKTAEQK